MAKEWRRLARPEKEIPTFPLIRGGVDLGVSKQGACQGVRCSRYDTDMILPWRIIQSQKAKKKGSARVAQCLRSVYAVFAQCLRDSCFVSLAVLTALGLRKGCVRVRKGAQG